MNLCLIPFYHHNVRSGDAKEKATSILNQAGNAYKLAQYDVEGVLHDQEFRGLNLAQQLSHRRCIGHAYHNFLCKLTLNTFQIGVGAMIINVLAVKKALSSTLFYGALQVEFQTLEQMLKKFSGLSNKLGFVYLTAYNGIFFWSNS